jgi:tetratricopeptide (TPR) repeat protein
LRVLRNVIGPLPPSISVRLRGTKSNRDAIGAVVTLGQQMRTAQAGSGFLSQHSKDVFFGLGDAQGPFTLEIRWPSGARQRVENVAPNHRVFVTEGGEHRTEPFLPTAVLRAADQPSERLPEAIGTWLLAPVAAPDAVKGPALLALGVAPDVPGVRVFPIAESRAPVYNILFKFLFDRHRDIAPPAGFLVDGEGQIVKVYQGHIDSAQIAADSRRIPRTAAERVLAAVPFKGDSATYEFQRNQLSYGSAFFQREYYTEAGAFFRAALKDDPASAEALYGVGSVALKLGDAAEARLSFEQTLKMQAGYLETKPNALNNLGLLATREGDTERAIGYFEQALRLYPDLLVALQNLGNAYRQQKRFNDARIALERAMAVAPENAEVRYSLGMVFAQTGDAGRAHDLLREAIAIRPAYPEALNNLGILYLRTQRRDLAVAQFEQAIRAAPDFDQAYLNLAMVYSIEGNGARAREVLTALLKRQPGNGAARQALEKLP